MARRPCPLPGLPCREGAGRQVEGRLKTVEAVLPAKSAVAELQQLPTILPKLTILLKLTSEPVSEPFVEDLPNVGSALASTKIAPPSLRQYCAVEVEAWKRGAARGGAGGLSCWGTAGAHRSIVAVVCSSSPQHWAQGDGPSGMRIKQQCSRRENSIRRVHRAPHLFSATGGCWPHAALIHNARASAFPFPTPNTAFL